jgi:formylglycine-generating enzyme required for sulfatase activity
MVAVEGNMLVDRRGRDDSDDVERAQDKTCEVWRVPGRVCDKFSEEKWKEAAQAFPRKKMQFCIDRFEYPNRLGEYPLVVATYSESAAYCAREKKRLCTETEWTFACEGEEGRPYPYGYVRDATACPIDRPRIEPDDETFAPRTTARTAKGIDTMWKGERSGAFARCTSPFGVRDTTGNVDEWTTSVRSWGYRMILKGGHWSPVRGRCRPQTRGHGPLYVNVETGFRCCS